jgi:LysM repeat protein
VIVISGFLGLFIFLILLINVVGMAGKLSANSTQIQELNTRLTASQQQLTATKQQLTASQRQLATLQNNDTQNQDELLKQAQSVKEVSSLAYRKLLEAAARMDHTTNSGKTAIQLLGQRVLYTIVVKDTFTTIAQNFSVTTKALQDENPTVAPAQLQVGQVLTIPGEKVAS